MLDSFPQGSYNGPVFYCFSKLMSNKFQTHFINRYLSYNRGNLEWIHRDALGTIQRNAMLIFS